MLLHILPLAAGAAVSPALIGASVEILVAFRSRAIAMLLLYLAGAGAIVAAVFAVSFVLPRRPASGSGLVEDTVDVVLGSVLVILACVLRLRRPSSGTSGSTVGRLVTSRWVGFGVVGLGMFMMVTNVSTVVLLLAGAHEASAESLTVAARWIGYGVLALGALTPILVPLIWFTVRPGSASRELDRFSAFLAKHGRTLGVIVCLLTGLYLLARGFKLI